MRWFATKYVRGLWKVSFFENFYVRDTVKRESFVENFERFSNDWYFHRIDLTEGLKELLKNSLRIEYLSILDQTW